MPCLPYVFLSCHRDLRVLTSSIQVSVLWKDSPENPKNASGGEKKEPKTKKPVSEASSKPSSKKAERESPSSDTD